MLSRFLRSLSNDVFNIISVNKLSIESIVEFVSAGDNYINDAEFIHYFNFLKGENDKQPDIYSTFWSIIHPEIIEVSRKKFFLNLFSEAVRSAFVEIEDKIRKAVKAKTNEEFSGDVLMRKAFSPNNPIITLDILTTQEGKDIQRGYMDIFAGSIAGIRNPKSHRNFEIDKERAIHFLFLSSLLMYKFDEALGKES